MSDLGDSLNAAHRAIRDLPTSTDVCALYADTADRAERVWPGQIGVAIVGVLRLAREHRIASGFARHPGRAAAHARAGGRCA